MEPKDMNTTHHRDNSSRNITTRTTTTNVISDYLQDLTTINYKSTSEDDNNSELHENDSDSYDNSIQQHYNNDGNIVKTSSKVTTNKINMTMPNTASPVTDSNVCTELGSDCKMTKDSTDMRSVAGLSFGSIVGSARSCTTKDDWNDGVAISSSPGGQEEVYKSSSFVTLSEVNTVESVRSVDDDYVCSEQHGGNSFDKNTVTSTSISSTHVADDVYNTINKGIFSTSATTSSSAFREIITKKKMIMTSEHSTMSKQKRQRVRKNDIKPVTLSPSEELDNLLDSDPPGVRYKRTFNNEVSSSEEEDEVDDIDDEYNDDADADTVTQEDESDKDETIDDVIEGRSDIGTSASEQKEDDPPGVIMDDRQGYRLEENYDTDDDDDEVDPKYYSESNEVNFAATATETRRTDASNANTAVDDMPYMETIDTIPIESLPHSHDVSDDDDDDDDDDVESAVTFHNDISSSIHAPTKTALPVSAASVSYQRPPINASTGTTRINLSSYRDRIVPSPNFCEMIDTIPSESMDTTTNSVRTTMTRDTASPIPPSSSSSPPAVDEAHTIDPCVETSPPLMEDVPLMADAFGTAKAPETTVSPPGSPTPSTKNSGTRGSLFDFRSPEKSTASPKFFVDSAKPETTASPLGSTTPSTKSSGTRGAQFDFCPPETSTASPKLFVVSAKPETTASPPGSPSLSTNIRGSLFDFLPPGSSTASPKMFVDSSKHAFMSAIFQNTSSTSLFQKPESTTEAYSPKPSSDNPSSFFQFLPSAARSLSPNVSAHSPKNDFAPNIFPSTDSNTLYQQPETDMEADLSVFLAAVPPVNASMDESSTAPQIDVDDVPRSISPSLHNDDTNQQHYYIPVTPPQSPGKTAPEPATSNSPVHLQFSNEQNNAGDLSSPLATGGRLWQLAGEIVKKEEQQSINGDGTKQGAAKVFTQNILFDKTRSRADVGAGVMTPPTPPRPIRSDQKQMLALLEEKDKEEFLFRTGMFANKRVRVAQLLLIGLVGILFGWLGNFFVNSSCYFASAPVTVGQNGDVFALHFGLWNFSPVDSALNGYKYCYPYSGNRSNDAPIGSRVFNLLALILGTYSLVVLWCYLITGRALSIFWRIAVFSSMLAGILQFLTLSFFFGNVCHNSKCVLGPAAIISIITAIAWIILGAELFYNCPLSASSSVERVIGIGDDITCAMDAEENTDLMGGSVSKTANTHIAISGTNVSSASTSSVRDFSGPQPASSPFVSMSDLEMADIKGASQEFLYRFQGTKKRIDGYSPPSLT